MSDSLTNGFLKSEIIDNNPESSIDRVLDEARVDSGPFRNYLKAAFCESPQDKLDKLTDVLHEVSNKDLEHKLAAVLDIFPERLIYRLWDYLDLHKRDVEELPSAVQNSVREMKENEGSEPSLQDPRWHALVASKQAELIATHLWPNDPERLFEFAKQYDNLRATNWEVVFSLYGNSPHEALFNYLETQGPEGSLDVKSCIWNSWSDIDDPKQSYASYKDRMSLMAEWHKRLVNLGLFTEAARVEKCCPHPQNHRHEGFLFQMVQQMEWERLSRTVPLRSDEDKQRCVELAFHTGNSFLEPDCSSEVITQLINTSVEVNFREEYNCQIENHISLKRGVPLDMIHLHELWYASDHRRRWVDVLERHLDGSDISRKLQILDHVLKAQSWTLGNSDECPGDGYTDWLRVKVEEQHWNTWHKRLMAIGDSFRNGETKLSYEDLILWIKIVIEHGYRSGVERKDLVPYADKALVFLRPYLNEPPENFKIESCEMAYRILLTYAPDKLIGNLLPAIVKADHPCSGEKLEYGAGSSLHLASKNYEYPLLWWFSVMISNALRVSLAWKNRSEYIREDDVRTTLTSSEMDAGNLNLRKEFAEFCLKNLALKKGKSCKEGKYADTDCMEERPLLREAFAKALSEIGLDLGGDVHKRLNFVKNSDPDESVRKAAAEAYKSVRRQEHHNEDDPVKGMLISFWWFRLAQRKALDLEVDPAGAAKTRRNELRYASHVREIVYEIREISAQIL